MLLTGAGLIILLSAAILHYFQHFRFIICKKLPMPRSPKVISNSVVNPSFSDLIPTANQYTLKPPSSFLRSVKRTKCICSMKAVDDEEFDFFPMAFLIYLIFVILLTVTICITKILNYIQYKNDNTMNGLLFTFSIESYHNNSLFQMDGPSMIHIFDYILVYGVMITSIWESLFSFYRCYTTYRVATKLQCTSTKQVLQRFIIYATIYTMFYILTIHLYYWLFPMIILMHSIFNLYCNWRFAQLLIDRYQIFADITEDIHGNNANQEMLDNIYFMKRTSMICCVLQIIYLSAFIITYNVSTICILPILWSLNCLLFAFNFIRNRQSLRHIFVRCKQYNKKQQKINQVHIHQYGPSINVIDNNTKTEFVESYQINNDKKLNLSSDDQKQDVYEQKEAQHQQTQKKQIHLTIEDDLNTNTVIPEFEDSVNSGMRKKKALYLLGIMDDRSATNNRLPPLKQGTEQNSSSRFSPWSNKSKSNSKSKSKSKKSNSKNKNIDTLNIGTLKHSVSDRRLPNSINGINKHVTFKRFKENKSAPTTPNRTTANTEDTAKYNMESADFVFNSDVEDDGNEEILIEVSLERDEDEQHVNIDDDGDENNDEKEVEITWSYQPNDSDKNEANDITKTNSIREAMFSLQVLSKYGFSSKINLNSMNELIKYNDKVNKTNHTANFIRSRTSPECNNNRKFNKKNNNNNKKKKSDQAMTKASSLRVYKPNFSQFPSYHD